MHVQMFLLYFIQLYKLCLSQLICKFLERMNLKVWIVVKYSGNAIGECLEQL